MRFGIDEEAWPPDQRYDFTPLALIRYQGQHSIRQATAMAQLIQTGDIHQIASFASNHSVPEHHLGLDNHDHEPLQEVLSSSTVTKELTEILAPLEQSEDPQFILIEGAPGIGKSMLLKEIAYRWGKKELLKTFRLVLLVCLCNPNVQQASEIKDLLRLFCSREDMRATEISTASCEYFVQNGGKGIAFLFDGFDEYPEALQKNRLIADILKRKELPHCALVVSSRPHATAQLREQATIRVEILGFTKIERNQFIQQALKGQPQSINELTQYLEYHYIIGSLCVVPFNMVALLFLYKQRIPLPKNSAELYNNFICLTICRHLVKCGHNVKIPDLDSLPDPYRKIIHQLSKFSLEALDNNKLVFTFDEIRKACPDIKAVPGAVNGFGLLRAVQHFCFTGEKTILNFLHLSIQEFLAAYYIANLPPHKELKILKEKFWSDNYSNVFATYVAHTKGQRPSFKQFIKPSLVQRFKGFLKGEEVMISNQFLDTTLKCLYLFRCFYEVGSKDICSCIETAKIFDTKSINFCNIRLSPSDVECVVFFLTFSSHKQWKELNLSGCYIQDIGLNILHRGLKSGDVTIETLQLGFNNLTESSSSAISDITISCRVKMLSINGNKTVGEDERLYSIISDPSSVLETLHMWLICLSSAAIIKLFIALSESKNLRVLWIYSKSNDINDEVCDAIAMAMKKNASLVELLTYDIPIRGECVNVIIEALKHNKTLQHLCLPFSYDPDIKDEVRLLAEEINQMRESCECQVKLEIDYA